MDVKLAIDEAWKYGKLIKLLECPGFEEDKKAAWVKWSTLRSKFEGTDYYKVIYDVYQAGYRYLSKDSLLKARAAHYGETSTIINETHPDEGWEEAVKKNKTAYEEFLQPYEGLPVYKKLTKAFETGRHSLR